MNAVAIALLTILVYICIYSLIDRICKCVEHCATAKGFSKAVESTSRAVHKDDGEKHE